MLQTLRTRPIDETKPTMVMGLKDGTLNFGLLLFVVVVFERAGICSTSQVAIWNQQRYNNVF
jgi:hypothetical protein